MGWRPEFHADEPKHNQGGHRENSTFKYHTRHAGTCVGCYVAMIKRLSLALITVFILVPVTVVICFWSFMFLWSILGIILSDHTYRDSLLLPTILLLLPWVGLWTMWAMRFQFFGAKSPPINTNWYWLGLLCATLSSIRLLWGIDGLLSFIIYPMPLLAVMFFSYELYQSKTAT
jgi:hypothetical protein